MPKKYHLIHERGDAPPLPAEDVATAWTSCIDETVGHNNGPAFFVYQDGWGPIVCYEKSHQQVVGWIFDKINQDQKYVEHIKNVFEQRTQEIYDYIKVLDKVDWKSADIEGIIEHKEKFRQIYYRFVPYGEPLPYFLKEKLEEVLGQYLLKELKISTEDYQTLITPLHQSFLSREEAELQKIVDNCEPGSKKYQQEITAHAAKYRWLLYDYASVVVDEKYFREKAEKFRQNPPEFIDYKKLAGNKQNIIKRHKISGKYRYYLEVSEGLFYLMDKKKEILTRFNLAIRPLYIEIARRLDVKLDDLYWYFWHEVKAALQGEGKVSVAEVARRRHLSISKMHNWKNEFLDEKEAKKMIEDIKKDSDVDENQETVKGTPASSGKVRGIVCHLKSASENDKLKLGEILLVGNTTPDYMPAIKNAAAIITNEGGLTCHAAIISRELKIPCVVGTVNGTQIFKTGDKVEVDATGGIIKKL